MPFHKPLSHLREYVTICRALLEEGEVNHEGELITARAQLPGGPTRVTTMISALREKAWSMSGEITAGGISWMSPLPYIRDVALPAQQAGADLAGRDRPQMVVHTPIILSEDTEAIRAAAKRQFGFYQRLPYYSQMLQDAGYDEAAGTDFTDRMADALIISAVRRLRSAIGCGRCTMSMGSTRCWPRLWCWWTTPSLTLSGLGRSSGSWRKPTESADWIPSVGQDAGRGPGGSSSSLPPG